MLKMVPLGIHSHYSLMRGTASPEELALHAKRLAYKVIALTDMDSLYGLWPYINACKRHGLRPIIGAEITGENGNTTLLVESDEGYANLCRIITARKCAEGFDIKTAVLENHKGLVIIATDPSQLTTFHNASLPLYAAVPVKVSACSRNLRETAKYLGIPAVATADSFLLTKEDRKFHQLLRAIDLNTGFSRLTASDLALPDAYLASPAEYRKRFDVMPEAVKITGEIAERCHFDSPPKETVFPPWKSSNGKTATEVLKMKAYKGAQKRYGRCDGKVAERLKHELGIIMGKGFAEYFLVVQSIVKRSPRICGRGSGAASLVAYCLGITNVCPIRHNLYFERFLNPGRKDPPDIDVDFAWDERDDVINSVLREYEGRSAMVCNHVFFKPRMALRETAKVFGLSESEIKGKTGKLSWQMQSKLKGGNIQEELEAMPESKWFQLNWPEPWPEILGLAGKLIGTPRNLSVHPGGVVITPKPIDSHVPIEIATKGVPVIQWEKDGAEEAGLVKIDLLGNRSLGVIRDAIKNTRKNGVTFDESQWKPEDDKATQEIVRKGLTMGCFYIESPATRLLQEKARQGDFEHMVIHSSIIRPAANDYIRDYLYRLHGGKWKPIHPLLKDVLDETFGIMVYQEDVSKIAVALAGFSHVQADILRKVMSKKDKEHHLSFFREKFFEGARKNGVSEEQIEKIWKMIMSFDGYSFCKPHSASYARVSFQAAYLKRHFPAEFMAAVISNRGGFYSTFAYVSEAVRFGCKILPPDINLSGIKWKGKKRKIRVGLQSVSGLSNTVMQKIVDERGQSLFKGFDDFLQMIKPPEDETRSLIYCGAFKSLEPEKSQADLLWRLACWRKFSDTEKKTGLIETGLPCKNPRLPLEPELEVLRRQYSTLGFLCDRHPMVLFEKAISSARPVKVKDIRRHVGGKVTIGGWLITGKTVRTKHGDPMKFLTFEDDTGIVETVFFPKAYERFCRILESHKPYLISGKVEEEFGAVTINVTGTTAI